jgi:hypothetical protein
LTTPTGYEYRIEGQKQEPDRDPRDGIVKNGWTVKVRDGMSGTAFTVFVPEEFYSAQNVASAIADKLQHVREVAMLGG